MRLLDHARAREAGDGAEADPNFGRNHPVISAMGFVREEQRRSGLTRKKNTTPPKS